MDKQEKINNYREKNKHIISGQIVCAGSSLMEMFPVEKLMAETNREVVIYNRGIGGFVTQELLEALDVCILDLKPRRLFLNIGTNDLSDASIPIAEIMERYDEILSRVEMALPGVEIYLMAYYPINYEAAAEEMKPCLLVRTNEKIDRANWEVRKLAERHGARYIDVNDALKDEQGRLKAEYTIEGMHIKEEGYRAIWSAFLSYVMEPMWKGGDVR
ncbi:MAG: lysophospholipase [Acetatifactor sp.]|nr:lysophospholipase [Acetatifactor sp.]